MSTSAIRSALKIQDCYIANYNATTASDHLPVYSRYTLCPPYAPTISAGSAVTFCEGGNVLLNSTSAESYQWYKNGIAVSEATGQSFTATETGSYTVIVVNGNGCTSGVSNSISVTVNEPTTASTDVIACDSYTWHDIARTSSGVYTFESVNEQGCTHTETLNLTINQSSAHTTTITSCDSYTWSGPLGNGLSYTTSGTYTNVTTNAQGCPHTETLELTITHSSSHTTIVTNCDSYTWSAPLGNGVTYTTSGTHTNVTTNEQGCPHTETLELTITHSSSHTTTITNCNSYTWSGPLGNGVTYTISGTYTNVTTNAQGCPHTETLHLTINPKPNVSIADAYVLPEGVNKNTVYVGYTPASVLSVTAIPSAGTPGYSFNWSAASGLSIVAGTATQSTVKVFANSSGNYSSALTVTITDSKGCTATATISIHVLDVRSGNKNDKVTVCHNGNNLSLSGNAVQAHLSHGDVLGNCNTIFTSARISSAGTGTKNEELSQSFNVKVAPNPSVAEFRVQVQSNSNAEITIRLVDVSGRVIAIYNKVYKNETITIGKNLAGGSYFLEVIQGINSKKLKLIKLK